MFIFEKNSYFNILKLLKLFKEFYVCFIFQNLKILFDFDKIILKNNLLLLIHCFSIFKNLYFKKNSEIFYRFLVCDLSKFKNLCSKKNLFCILLNNKIYSKNQIKKLFVLNYIKSNIILKKKIKNSIFKFFFKKFNFFCNRNNVI